MLDLLGPEAYINPSLDGRLLSDIVTELRTHCSRPQQAHRCMASLRRLNAYCRAMKAPIERVFGMLERKGQRPRLIEEMSPMLQSAWDRVLSRAVEVFGSEEEAAKWLDTEAIGLPDRQRPAAMLHTPEGIQMIEEYLTQIEFGVYR